MNLTWFPKEQMEVAGTFYYEPHYRRPAAAADCRLIDLYEAKKPGGASCKHPPDMVARVETAANVPDILIRGA